jgi:hypothetical protein
MSELPGDGLPPATPEQEQFDDRLQELTQNIQEQAFLLGYRNGYREGELVQGLLAWARKRSMEADSSEERTAWMDVEHHLASNGAFIQEDDEITFPPGFTAYIGAADSRPYVQVAGNRIHIQDFDLTWKPNDHAESVDDFEPHREEATLELEFTVDLPRDSEQREALLQFLEGLR